MSPSSETSEHPDTIRMPHGMEGGTVNRRVPGVLGGAMGCLPTSHHTCSCIPSPGPLSSPKQGKQEIPPLNEMPSLLTDNTSHSQILAGIHPWNLNIKMAQGTCPTAASVLRFTVSISSPQMRPPTWVPRLPTKPTSWILGNTASWALVWGVNKSDVFNLQQQRKDDIYEKAEKCGGRPSCTPTQPRGSRRTGHSHVQLHVHLAKLDSHSTPPPPETRSLQIPSCPAMLRSRVKQAIFEVGETHPAPNQRTQFASKRCCPHPLFPVPRTCPFHTQSHPCPCPLPSIPAHARHFLGKPPWKGVFKSKQTDPHPHSPPWRAERPSPRMCVRRHRNTRQESPRLPPMAGCGRKEAQQAV